MSLIVDRARAQDHDDWLELWLGYFRFYRTTVGPAVYELMWRRMLADDPAASGRLARREPGGAPIALAHYCFHPHVWSTGEACYLSDVFVAPDARRLGAARALIHAVADIARARSCTRYYWLTYPDNRAGRALYDQIAHHDGSIEYAYPL